MSDKSKIEWCDATWNPVTGCRKVSPGCDHCYAETFAERWRGIPGHYFEHGFDVTLRADKIDQPLRWTRPRRIFVNSMSDLFHDDVPDNFIARVFVTMAATPQHTYQLLTKRHGRMRSLLSSDAFQVKCMTEAWVRALDIEGTPWPLPNVWGGVSAEDQPRADLRIPALLATPLAVRFVSAEPLLGPVRLAPEWLLGRPGLDWVIGGGESGAAARRCEIGWLESLRSGSAAAGVPFFCKQLGSVLGRELGAGPKGGDWGTWPAGLRVRDFPRSAEVTAA